MVIVNKTLRVSGYSTYAGTGSGSWNNVGNVVTNDSAYAETSGNLSYNQTSGIMFSYAPTLFASIPENAVIKKITIYSEYRQNDGTGTWTGRLYQGSDSSRSQVGSRTGGTGSVGTSFKGESYEYTGSAITSAVLRSKGLSFESQLLNRRLLGSKQYLRYAYVEISYEYEDVSFEIQYGTVRIKKAFKGTNEIKKVYNGTKKI